MKLKHKRVGVPLWMLPDGAKILTRIAEEAGLSRGEVVRRCIRNTLGNLTEAEAVRAVKKIK